MRLNKRNQTKLTNNLHTAKQIQVFQSNINNFQAIIWFQVTDNKNP